MTTHKPILIIGNEEIPVHELRFGTSYDYDTKEYRYDWDLEIQLESQRHSIIRLSAICEVVIDREKVKVELVGFQLQPRSYISLSFKPYREESEEA